MLGVALPDSVVTGDLLANPWDDSVTDDADPENGHCIVASDFADGLSVETWGAVKPLSYGFAGRYIDEAYAVFSQDWLCADGNCPAGIDAALLQQDLEEIANV